MNYWRVLCNWLIKEIFYFYAILFELYWSFSGRQKYLFLIYIKKCYLPNQLKISQCFMTPQKILRWFVKTMEPHIKLTSVYCIDFFCIFNYSEFLIVKECKLWNILLLFVLFLFHGWLDKFKSEHNHYKF